MEDNLTTLIHIQVETIISCVQNNFKDLTTLIHIQVETAKKSNVVLSTALTMYNANLFFNVHINYVWIGLSDFMIVVSICANTYVILCSLTFRTYYLIES